MSFSVNDYIYSLDRQHSGEPEQQSQKLSYAEVLDKVRSAISDRFAAELASSVVSDQAQERLRSIIQRIVTSERLVDSESATIGQMTDRLYEDMAGFSFLSAYLADETVEEININGESGVWVNYNNSKRRSDHRFTCSADCLNMVRKMTALGNVILDGSKPLGDSFICKGVRISAAISPCVDPDVQAVASIRKQQTGLVTRESLIESGTYSDEELRFLETCLTHGVSVGICGGVGSGKTSDLALLLQAIPEDKRIITIEDTRELNLLRFDDSGMMINDVVHLLTKEGAKPVSMQQLTKVCLRFSPDYIVPAEMRGVETLDVANAGITGHTIASTLHADSAAAAYDRLLSMCMPVTHLSEERMLNILVQAFPLMAYKEKLPDGSRRLMEVFEATGTKMGPDGRTVQVVGKYIYKYEISGYERDENGRPVKVIGRHKRVGNISAPLANTLLKRGLPKEQVAEYQTQKKKPEEKEG